jgi:hypothetical protein
MLTRSHASPDIVSGGLRRSPAPEAGDGVDEDERIDRLAHAAETRLQRMLPVFIARE